MHLWLPGFIYTSEHDFTSYGFTLHGIICTSALWHTATSQREP